MQTPTRARGWRRLCRLAAGSSSRNAEQKNAGGIPDKMMLYKYIVKNVPGFEAPVNLAYPQHNRTALLQWKRSGRKAMAHP